MMCVMHTTKTICQLGIDLFLFISNHLRSRSNLAAENLFLRKQLALYQERGKKPGRIDTVEKLTLIGLSKLFYWKAALIVVQPQTLVRWHRMGFRFFWRWKSRPGRPSIPEDIRRLIQQMARENSLWGEERIANELLLKLGIRVSPRTVRKYMPKEPSRGPRSDQCWSTFLRNHAGAILACDFFVVVTVTFRTLYVFIILEHGSRRILHCNATSHPTSEWAMQQFRQAIPSDHRYRYVIHDRGRVFSKELDGFLENMELRVLRTPYRSPKANSICERAIGSMRRECLDHMIPLTENHLRRIFGKWVSYYNQSRPHSSLGPGIPEPTSWVPRSLNVVRHHLKEDKKVISRSVLNGLHHDYRLVPLAA
jgi:transposase InsO family protein